MQVSTSMWSRQNNNWGVIHQNIVKCVVIHLNIVKGVVIGLNIVKGVVIDLKKDVFEKLF